MVDNMEWFNVFGLIFIAVIMIPNVVFAMKGIKIELLGIAIIPLGIAVTTNNFWG